jgi:hypothetical protein
MAMYAHVCTSGRYVLGTYTTQHKYLSGFRFSNEVVAAVAYAYAFDRLHRVKSAIAEYFSVS